jgi:hypothetical protein
MTAINAEVLVGREDDGIRKSFGHTNEASIGETHGDVGIFINQLDDRVHVFGQLKGNDEGTPPKELTKTRRASFSEKVVSFGQNRFARHPRWR